MSDQFIPVERIQHLIETEAFILFGVLLTISFLFYKIFLKKISEKRHANLQARFKIVFLYILITGALAGSYWIMHFQNLAPNLSSYVALLALFLGAVMVVKLAQIFIYIYLFLANMSVGVPRLIANIFTLLFSLVIISWIAAEVFEIQLAAVLATSAVFSLVLGLALQDTLGNLFSGVAFQFDRLFNIGDWIEIHLGQEKWTGQVQEINWRATTLMGFADELILIPNRMIAQSQFINFSHLQKPARLNQTFRFRFDVSTEVAKMALLEGLQNTPGILNDPAPRTLITEITDSWITIKIFYSLKDYGMRYRTGDEVITNILARIRHHGLSMAHPTMQLFES